MIARYIYLFLSVSLASCSIVKFSDAESSDSDWWKTATIYQIYPKSFRDSNGDGFGDLKGIIEKLDYIGSLGVNAIWLSPIFESPQKDNGYDISNYKKVDNIFGSNDDFKDLIKKAHEKGLKVIIDFVPNHTSDQHDWFKKSAKNDTQYRDYYVWKDCTVDKNEKVLKPPNNWVSAFGGSAWTYNKDRKQCYLHQFLKEQPDLNYWNDSVLGDMKEILLFWLFTNEVDGVRIDAVPHIYENNTYPNEPFLNESDKNAGLNHIYTMNQPKTFDLISNLRELLDNLSNPKDQNNKIMFTEATDLLYYGDGKTDRAHFTFNFKLLGLNKKSTAKDIGDSIKSYTEDLRKLSPKYIPNWVLGNHDTYRIASKVGSEKVDGLNMLTSFLPGIQLTYQGEEIGMTNGEVDCKTQGKDFKDDCKLYPSVTRDYERTPFQWSSETNAGFSKNKPWLPIAKGFKTINVAEEDKSNSSHLHIYQDAQKLRKQLRNKAANTVEVVSSGDKVLHLRRGSSSNTVFDFLFNLDAKNISVTLTPKGKVQLLRRTKGEKTSGEISQTLTLDAYESIVVSYERSGSATFTFSYIMVLILGLVTRF